MTDILFEYDHILLRSEYKTPEKHSHLAAHLIVSLGGGLTCEVCGERFTAGGVCIASDTEHTVHAETGDMLLYLFDTASYYCKELSDKYLTDKPYCVLDNELTNKIRSVWTANADNINSADNAVMTVMGLDRQPAQKRDERINEALVYLRQLDTVPEGIMDILCKKVYLSKSRFSHLFREQVGISLHRYLALDKMKKGYIHFMRTGSITDAAMYAGFDSPSHFAATCKRMFGISFSEFADSMKDSS